MTLIPIKRSNIGQQCELKQWRHLRYLEIRKVNATSVMLPISQDSTDILMIRELRNGDVGGPYATTTLLGWTTNGPMVTDRGHHWSGESTATSHFLAADDNQHQQMETFWKLEEWDTLVNKKPEMSVTTRKHYPPGRKASHRRRQTVITSLPFPSSIAGVTWQPSAETQLRGHQRRLNRDTTLKKNYSANMQSPVDKGYAKRVDHAGAEGATWYLPQHPVYHPKKPGKVRVVLDCAAKYEDVSLSDQVLQGPDLTNSLLRVVLRLSQEPVAPTGDIEVMFHRVRVAGNDRDGLVYLWWTDGDISKNAAVYKNERTSIRRNMELKLLQLCPTGNNHGQRSDIPAKNYRLCYEEPSR